MINHLESERIILIEMKEEDWPNVHKYASQPIVCQYQPWGPNTEEESELFTKGIIEDAKLVPRSRYVFSVFEKKSNKMIGSGEFNLRDRSNRAGEIAYIIHPDYWGKGIATEVAQLLIKLGFYEFKLHRIYATCDPRNSGSIKVLEKIGMTKEGRMREDLLIKDGWRDSFLYSILEKEWGQYEQGSEAKVGLINPYIQSALNQIKVAISTIVEMIDKLEDSDLEKRPTANKHSIGELLEHIALICKADSLIANGASEEEMSAFYSSVTYGNLGSIKEALLSNFQLLEDQFMVFTEDELQEEITSFWGVTYTRYEWLLEMVAHIYHHRGQLQAMLVHCYKQDPEILLFE